MNMPVKSGTGALAELTPGDIALARGWEHTPIPGEATSAFSEEERHDYLTRFGWQSNAYFSLQEGIEYFDVRGVGFIAYHRQRWLWGEVPIVFTRPMCASSDLERLLRLFLEQHGRRAIFVGVDAEVAGLLRRVGFTTNVCSTEFDIPLERFSLKGRDKRYLRWAQNNCEKSFDVRELTAAQTDTQAVLELSTAWRRTKAVKGRELRLTTRPPEYVDRWGVRRFYAFKGE
jgi:lysylphosphatidylglycerol synthetase-like protein (DUF2156 family)